MKVEKAIRYSKNIWKSKHYQYTICSDKLLKKKSDLLMYIKFRGLYTWWDILMGFTWNVGVIWLIDFSVQSEKYTRAYKSMNPFVHFCTQDKRWGTYRKSPNIQVPGTLWFQLQVCLVIHIPALLIFAVRHLINYITFLAICKVFLLLKIFSTAQISNIMLKLLWTRPLCWIWFTAQAYTVCQVRDNALVGLNHELSMLSSIVTVVSIFLKLFLNPTIGVETNLHLLLLKRFASLLLYK